MFFLIFLLISTICPSYTKALDSIQHLFSEEPHQDNAYEPNAKKRRIYTQKELDDLCKGIDYDSDNESEIATQPITDIKKDEISASPMPYADITSLLDGVNFEFDENDESSPAQSQLELGAPQAVMLPRSLKARFAELLFDGHNSLIAIASAINAETKCIDLSFYEMDTHIKHSSGSNKFNPILCALYNKKGCDVEANILINRKMHFHKLSLVELLMSCACKVKISDTRITRHESNADHSLHQKIYLFANAYQGEPVCFISSQNPTDHSILGQHNSMLMLSGPELYAQLKKRFKLLFTHYSKTVDEINGISKTELLEAQSASKVFEASLKKLEKVPTFLDYKHAIELTPETKVILLKTPLEKDRGDEIVDQIEKIIDESTVKIYFMHRSLTDAKIVHALIRAKKRGVNIHVLLDKSSVITCDNKVEQIGYHAMITLHEAIKDTRDCSLGFLIHPGGTGRILHDKTLACEDNYLVAVGSWNSTGNSTLYSCELTAICKGNKELYEQITKKFIELKNYTDDSDNTFYRSSQEIIDHIEKNRLASRLPLTPLKLSRSYSYRINNWN
jgi:phosphatidylserine/phosphatidylglycerophosphate/cardiolipin synthase-like enzyme